MKTFLPLMRKTLMRKIPAWLWLGCVVALGMIAHTSAQAAAITINSNTQWSSINTGTGTSNRPGVGDTITVGNGATLTVNRNDAVSGNIQLGSSNGAGSLVFNSNAVLVVSGGITLGSGSNNGNLTMSAGGSLTLRQFVYTAGTFTPGSGSVIMSASNTLPNTPSLANFFNFTPSTASTTTTLSRDTNIGGVLTLTNGVLDTNGKILTLSANCTSAISRPANGGFVSGNLRLTFPNGNATCTYPLGSTTGYAPIAMDVVGSGGTLTGASFGSEHPQVANSGIDATRNANRYWSLWRSGDTLAATSYGFTLSYNTGDLDLGATVGNFVLGRYNGAAWSLPAGFTRGTNTISLASQSGPLSSTLSFAVGEAIALCNPPSDVPQTMSCVCENFSRSSLNPSAIYGADWALSSSGGSFGVPRIISPGSLRLTDNTTTVATAATVPANFPAAGNLIVVEFKSYSYNGSAADGMALTLSDSSILPQPGAYGGSLGYAQKVGSDCTNPSGCAGFAGGWIGVALDEYGNFSNPTEGRSGGPGSRSDAIAVRGSGSGASTAATNYPYLDGTNSLTPGVDNAGSSTQAYGHAYRVMVDARSYTASNKTAMVSVYRDTSGAGSFNSGNRLLNFDAYQKNPSQAAVPSSWKLSFTGSTGGQANIHEISGLKICAQSLNPPTSFRIDIDNLRPGICSTVPAGRPTVTITALDINGNVVTNYSKTVTLKALLSGGAISSAVWSKLAANGTLTGNQYTFVAADNGVARFTLTDSVQEDVYVGVTENGSAFGVTYGSPMQYRGGSFSVNNVDSLGSDIAGGVVAGRAHLFSITRSNGCGTDTSYSGVKPLDAWYNVVAANQPAGALAPQLCNVVNGACLPTTGSCFPIPASEPALSASANNLPNINFTSGVGNFCLVTSDVGRYSLSVRDDSVVAAPIAGTSGNLTARPFAVVVSNVRYNAIVPNILNPASAANTDPASTINPHNAPVFVSAGTNFSAAVAGYLWNAAADGDANGLPDATASFANVTAAGVTPKYADTVSLGVSNTLQTFVPGAPGVPGTLSNGNIVVSAGMGSSNTLNYSEVGSFSLTAAPNTNYLGSGVDLSNRVAIYANPNLSSRSAWVGRFIPDHFQVAGSASLINRSDIGSGAGCAPASAFTYMGESMNFRFRVTAVNTADATTRNYFGNYAKLDASNWFGIGSNNSLGVGLLGINVPVTGGTCNAIFDFATPSHTSYKNCTGAIPADLLRTAGPRIAISGTPAAPTWLSGQATFASDFFFHRADSADGPFANMQIGVMPRDREGVTINSGLNMDADQNGANDRVLMQTMQLRYGRLRIDNAYGSELLPLPVNVQAQYWNGSKYVVSSDDNCTPLVAANLAMGLQTGGTDGINSTNMTAANIPANSGNTNGGNGVIRIAKPVPTPSKKGSATLSSLLNYLPGSGRLTWGVYKSGPVIYVRELY